MAVTVIAQSEVSATRSLQVWRSLMDWVSFLFQILVQIMRVTPSLAQVLSFVGIRNTLLDSSSSASFRPLPVVDLPLRHSPPEPVAPAHVGGGDGVGGDDQCLEKLTVVLDLDETLVCAYETSSLPPSVRTQAIEAGLKCFDMECVSSEKGIEGKPKISYVTVFERPGLHEFLRQIAEFADLVLFTAGVEGYAKPLVDRIDMEKRFRLHLYRPSTTSTKYRDHVKDLTCISKDMSRIVIVDNNPFSFLLQPLNGIPCTSFSAGQPHDDQLLEALLPLLKLLSQQNDVRPILQRKFHMPEWFQMHGIPTFPENPVPSSSGGT